MLGTEYSWNANGTRLSVTLRDGVKWPDGQPFTSADVVFTLDMLRQRMGINGTGYDGPVPGG